MNNGHWSAVLEICGAVSAAAKIAAPRNNSPRNSGAGANIALAKDEEIAAATRLCGAAGGWGGGGTGVVAGTNRAPAQSA